MANCHRCFQVYHGKIALTPTKRGNLKIFRDALRDRIRMHFKETRKEKVPTFWGQGSYAMRTTVNPLSGEYDVDDGVYLHNLDADKGKWPSPEVVHKWIVGAVEGQTNDTIDKRTCVRVRYAGQYHVDLPIYGEYREAYYLAEKGEVGWHESDPKKLTEWFKEEIHAKGDQLRRLVRYLKAWTDFQSANNGEMPSGIFLTVLAAEEFSGDDRDDISFSRTIRNIHCRVQAGQVNVWNPVDKSEDLEARLADGQRTAFRECIAALRDSADRSLQEESRKAACNTWREQFGPRFPQCEDEKEDGDKARVTTAPAILKDDARSA